MLTIQDIIDKRRRIWSQKKDLDLDKALVRASAVKILSTPSLVAEVQAKPYLLIEVAFYIVNKKRETVPFSLTKYSGISSISWKRSEQVSRFSS